MKKIFLGIILLVTTIQFAAAQANGSAATIPTQAEQELLDLSKAKWRWMAEKKIDTLNALFVDKAVFVHMSGKWGKTRELEVIKSGSIWYKQVETYSAAVNIFGNTAILLTDIDLLAVVGGNEVINPFMVTEVYLKENGKWRMGSLTFSTQRRAVKLAKP